MIDKRISELESLGLGLETDGRIRLVKYDECWASEFSKESRRISATVKIPGLRIFHIGSTSIPKIQAKPIIDILLTAPSSKALRESWDLFTQIGYEAKGEFGLEGRHYFVLSDKQRKKAYIHVHAWEQGRAEVMRHLIFRDYLRHYPEQAKKYEALKIEVVNRKDVGRSEYMNAKAPVIDELVKEAIAWASSHEAQNLSLEWRVVKEDSKCPDLETTRMYLEPITEEHAQELYELFSDSDLHKFVPFEPPTLEQQLEKCKRWAKRHSPDGKDVWLNWAARNKKSWQVIGHFQAEIRDEGVASIGYVVARKFQNQGFATEGLKAVFEHLRVTLNVREVKAWSDTRNVASHQLAKKLGLVQVDFIKDADTFKGVSSDEFVFSKVFTS